MGRKKKEELKDGDIVITPVNIVVDKTSVFNKEIKNKIADIKRTCLENDIPFFCVFGTQLRDNGIFTKETDSLLPEQYYVDGESSDNAFSDMVNILNGFTTIYQSGGEEIGTDELDISEDVLSGFEGFEE